MLAMFNRRPQAFERVIEQDVIRALVHSCPLNARYFATGPDQ